MLLNNELLNEAEKAGFDVLVTTDKNLSYQQNLSGRKIAIVVLGKSRWSLLLPRLKEIADAIIAAEPSSYTLINIPGR